ncbi:hypothetical protein [Sabulibacter ruber]|uniref:hypothetical protein n=1 Tax=Sabulibacter ruber TaxID=2811901 RepID=UPI001A95E591|nr:hypothetical protein [Sabulibacter ruber]
MLLLEKDFKNVVTSLVVVFLSVFFSGPSFGQMDGSHLQIQGVYADMREVAVERGPKGVKKMRTFVSSEGLFSMKPFVLKQELLFDEKARLKRKVDYTFGESIFGKDTTLAMKEYEYYKEIDKTFSIRNTLLKTVEQKRYKREDGHIYATDGRISKVFVHQSNSKVDTFYLGQGEKFTHPEPQVRQYSAYDSLSNGGYSGIVPRGRSFNNLNTIIDYDTIANGFIVKESTPEGFLLSEKKVLLDENKQVSHIINLGGKTGLGIDRDVSITKFLYDEEGNEIEKIVLDRKGKVLDKFSYTYNQRGDLEQTVWSGKRGKVKRRTKYEYEYF